MLLTLALQAGAILIWRFDGLYGQDAFAYYYQAGALRASLADG